MEYARTSGATIWPGTETWPCASSTNCYPGRRGPRWCSLSLERTLAAESSGPSRCRPIDRTLEPNWSPEGRPTQVGRRSTQQKGPSPSGGWTKASSEAFLRQITQTTKVCSWAKELGVVEIILVSFRYLVVHVIMNDKRRFSCFHLTAIFFTKKKNNNNNTNKKN